jgi:uncharacterized membrane protein
MTLKPLLDASPVIQIHVAAALAALVLGSVILFRKKGTTAHRAAGYVWVVLLLVTALSSFAIHELRVWGLWSPIHLLSVATILGLGSGIRLARAGRIRRHRNVMRATFFGALVIAGLFTLLPGRIMNAVVLGPGGNSMLAQTVIGTPLWVWPLLAGLILLVILRSRGRTMPYWRLYTVPWSSPFWR